MARTFVSVFGSGDDHRPSAGGGGSPVTPTVLGSGTATFSGASVATTASVSPASNKVVYLIFASAAAAGPVTDNVFTVTGNGLTWVRVEEHPDAGRRDVAIFRALGTASAGAITITDTGPENFNFAEVPWAVVQWDNANTGGSDGSGATGTPAVNAGNGTSLGLTITGTPGANDATFAAWQIDDTGTAITSDALWVNLVSITATELTLRVDWDAGQDLSPTTTWTGTASTSAIGFIVIAA